MIGITSRTFSPSSVVSRRRTPWVAGWCGPMLIVNSSSRGSAAVPEIGSSPMRSSVIERSRSRYGTSSGSLIPARHQVLVVGEHDGLAAHREVASLRMSLVVLGHEDPAVVGVPVEEHAKHVERLALLEVRRREELDDARHDRLVDADPGLHAQALDTLHREQLVVHAEARLLREVVAAVDAHEGVVPLVGLLAEVPEDVANARGANLERRPVAVEVG